MITLLLKRNTVTEAKDEEDLTLLHTDAYFCNVVISKLLIKYNPGIESEIEIEQTTLHTAGYYGSSQIVILLLEHKADTRARGLDKEIPLHSSV